MLAVLTLILTWIRTTKKRLSKIGGISYEKTQKVEPPRLETPVQENGKEGSSQESCSQSVARRDSILTKKIK